MLKTYFKFFPVETSTITSWNEDNLDEEQQLTYISALQNPVTFTDSYLAPDDSIYFLAKLGVIVQRTSKGEWLVDAVDTDLELTTIQQNEAGDIVLGGYEGALFYKKSGGEWQDNISILLFRNLMT